jgi:hypothetical protein
VVRANHTSPSVFLDNIFMGAGPDWAEQIAVADKVSIIELSMMLATLFLDIWMMLTHVPGPDMRDALGWTSSIPNIAKQRHPIP